MAERSDWVEATWDGRRLRQHQEFLGLPLAEKIEIIERLGEVAAFFAKRRLARRRSGTAPSD